MFFCDLSYAKSNSIWDFQYTFNLKKDKIATVFINKNTKSKKNNNRYVLKFRWTLYVNKNLILLSNYMGQGNQYVLKKRRSLDRVQIKLLQDGKDYNGRAYALIVFSAFDVNRQIATLDVYIKDEMKRMRIDFKESKR